MKCDYELAELAVSQAGYLGHEQAIARGFTHDAIKWRLKQKLWVPAGKGLYRVPGIVGDNAGLLNAAVAILPKATISHESAAELHQMAYVPRGKAVVTVHASTTHDFPGVKVHRSLDLQTHHQTILAGRPTTTPARTLNDLPAVLNPRQMMHVLDESLAARIATIDEIYAVFAEVARRGRTGTTTMRNLLNERLGSDMLTATRLERVGMRVFEAGEIERPIFQYPAPWDPTRRIDFAWPRQCVGCECDSLRWHTRVKDFQNDRVRDNRALAHRWRIYRFTWDDFTKRPDAIVAQLRQALAA